MGCAEANLSPQACLAVAVTLEPAADMQHCLCCEAEIAASQHHHHCNSDIQQSAIEGLVVAHLT